MKRAVVRTIVSVCFMVFCLITVQTACAEGLLPSLTQTVGVALPSPGEALERYPDSETGNDDGSITEIYTNVSEADFTAFSVYLEQRGAVLSEYHVEGYVLKAEVQMNGTGFHLEYDNEKGEIRQRYPAGTYDERVKSAKMHCDSAKKLIEEGKTAEAYEEILAIPQYEDYSAAADLIAGNADIQKMILRSTKGSTVTFGRFEQDNKTGNGKEEIEWIVLAVEDGKSLLLSKYGLCKAGEISSEDFYKESFSLFEQSLIQDPVSKDSDITGKVFSLNRNEVEQYVSEEDRLCLPTPYLKAQNWVKEAAKRDGLSTVDWFIRGKVEKIGNVAATAFVNAEGEFLRTNGSNYCYRPAMWVTIKYEANAEENVNETRYLEACAFLNEKKYDDAITAFEELDGYGDSVQKLKQSYYELGCRECGLEHYGYAISTLKNAGDYPGAEEKLAEIRVILHDREVAEFSTKYNDVYFSREYWTVLDVKKDKVLIISDDVLWECKYHNDPLEKGLKWGTCDLRGEMEEYYQTHFTALEKTAIIETKIEGVNDYVFALSKSEAEKYFAKNKQDAEKTGKPNRTRRHFWWTRTTGPKRNGNQTAYEVGYYSIDDNNVSNSKVATSSVYARPAMWIDLKSDYFWKLDE